MSTELPEDFDEDGTPASVPTKEPDATLALTDEGIEMPEFLRGYVGDFTIRTPNVTGELETTESGLPDAEVSDTIFAVYPNSGDYHGDLREGLLAISTPGHPETVFEIDDRRTEEA
jgi:hypothetical protein